MKADVITLAAGKAGTVELSDSVFGLEPRQDILHRMVVYQLAKRQSGNHQIKSRGEVMGTTKKFVRQKGSGGARHGNRKVGLFRGGARAFGPRPRSHAIDMPKKVRAMALRHALSAKSTAGELVILDQAKLDAPKTSELASVVKKQGWQKPLVIDGAAVDENFARAAQNLPEIDVLPAVGANVYDILRCGQLVLTKAAVEQLEARLS